jgi:hypothetical protein
MIEWIDFENKLFESTYFTINNNSKKKIVLFGNCHMATIGFFLNYLFNEQYDIYIVISWFFDKNSYDKFNMTKVNKNILNLLSKCDIFVYQQHIKDYGVQADIINTLINEKATVIKIPNLRLLFDSTINEEYSKSVNMLKDSIDNSDFKEYNFVIDNLTEIQFFNIPEHPTHYLLFLLSKSIKIHILKQSNYIMKLFYNPISIEDYFSTKNRSAYKMIPNYVILPGKISITNEICNITGIKLNSDYFD